MADRRFRWNWPLLAVLIVLYLVSLGAYTYANWQAEGQPHVLWTHAVNALILSLPLILFYGAIYILVMAWRQHRAAGRLDLPLSRVIYLAPRIAALVIVFFVGLFSLDVFDEGGTLLQQIGAFFIHSIPSIVMIVFIVLAWRRPVVGFIAFLLAGVFFLRFLLTDQGPGNFLLFSGPLLLIAALFYMDWRWNRPQAPLPDERGTAA